MADKIATIEAHLQSINSGPWQAYVAPGKCEVRQPGILGRRIAVVEDSTDASFIAHSREYVAFLLSEIHRLEAEVQAMQEQIERNDLESLGAVPVGSR